MGTYKIIYVKLGVTGIQSDVQQLFGQTGKQSHLQKQVLFLMVLLSGSFLLTSTVFWIYEQGRPEIQHFGDVTCWWFVTSATVGYGDLVPITTAGRAAGVIAIISGYSDIHISLE